MSLTVSVHEIEDTGTLTNIEQPLSDTPTNKKSTKKKKSSAATFLNTKSSTIGIPELFQTNLNHDPKLNK